MFGVDAKPQMYQYRQLEATGVPRDSFSNDVMYSIRMFWLVRIKKPEAALLAVTISSMVNEDHAYLLRHKTLFFTA